MLTELINNGGELVVAYAKMSNNKMKAKYSSYERGCVVIV